MWLKHVSPSELRARFPELATSLDDSFINHELHKLGIRYKTLRKDDRIYKEVALTQNHVMRFGTTDLGPAGSPEWFSFIEKKDRQADTTISLVKNHVLPTIRAHVTIKEKSNKSSRIPSFSYTFHCDSVEQLLTSSLEGFRYIAGLDLSPIVSKVAKQC